ncbi:multidrug resistance [Fusarium sp. NRRL 25303]|nr:multidrug resistance [Fusarium sp. NRRL 25303]
MVWPPTQGLVEANWVVGRSSELLWHARWFGSLLILDQATAASDPTSETLIQDALAKLQDRVTMVSIAHRLVTAKYTHKIVVADKGKVGEPGHHAELIAIGSAYAGMVEFQSVKTLEAPDLGEYTVSRDSSVIRSTPPDYDSKQMAADYSALKTSGEERKRENASDKTTEKSDKS